MFQSTLQHLSHGIVSVTFNIAGLIPLLLAADTTADRDNVPIPVWAASILLGALLALIGWMLQRAVNKLDVQLSAMEKRAAMQTDETRREQQALDKEHQKLRERVTRIEARCTFHKNQDEE